MHRCRSGHVWEMSVKPSTYVYPGSNPGPATQNPRSASVRGPGLTRVWERSETPLAMPLRRPRPRSWQVSGPAGAMPRDRVAGSRRMPGDVHQAAMASSQAGEGGAAEACGGAIVGPGSPRRHTVRGQPPRSPLVSSSPTMTSTEGDQRSTLPPVEMATERRLGTTEVRPFCTGWWARIVRFWGGWLCLRWAVKSGDPAVAIDFLGACQPRGSGIYPPNRSQHWRACSGVSAGVPVRAPRR